jgi:hypothetical protein
MKKWVFILEVVMGLRRIAINTALITGAIKPGSEVILVLFLGYRNYENSVANYQSPALSIVLRRKRLH